MEGLRKVIFWWKGYVMLCYVKGDNDVIGSFFLRKYWGCVNI